MKTSLLGLVVVVLVGGLMGCSSNSDGSSSDGSGGSVEGTPISCDNPDAHVCDDYGAVAEDELQTGTYCENANIVPSCATTDVRATCVYSDAYTGNTTTYWYTESTQLTDHDIKFACDELNGTLTMN